MRSEGSDTEMNRVGSSCPLWPVEKIHGCQVGAGYGKYTVPGHAGEVPQGRVEYALFLRGIGQLHPLGNAAGGAPKNRQDRNAR